MRKIAQRAGANIAAVTYHFGGKDGLYAEVLRRAMDAFVKNGGVDPDDLSRMDRNDALIRFTAHQVSALRRRKILSKYLKIFAWENVERTHVLDRLLQTERLVIFEAAGVIVRQFLPASVDREDIITATIWLLHQAEPFVRMGDRLSRPPLDLQIGEDFVERLSAKLARVASKGLSAWCISEHEGTQFPVIGGLHLPLGNS